MKILKFKFLFIVNGATVPRNLKMQFRPSTARDNAGQ